MVTDFVMKDEFRVRYHNFVTVTNKKTGLDFGTAQNGLCQCLGLEFRHTSCAAEAAF
jgi:hypothetical protein